MSDSCDALAIVEASTATARVPLCPEVRLRLLKHNAPMSRGWPDRLFADDGPRPYWAFAWGSGQALARYVLDHPQWVRARRVVDIGAGSGLAAIAARLAGAGEVVTIDKDPIAVAAIRCNAALNGVKLTVRLEDAFQNRSLRLHAGRIRTRRPSMRSRPAA